MKSLEKLIIEAQIITEPRAGSRTGDAGLVTPVAIAKGFAPCSLAMTQRLAFGKADINYLAEPVPQLRRLSARLSVCPAARVCD
ncbi:TcuB: works with TcuA to oxidize tricarballylate to cis-aconitate (plasmid) [Klebsiella aerogenes]|nr:TcuB: works with TcuA to oxidize tricarballylate to cis-aconitate [Klebsiella aerogenes]